MSGTNKQTHYETLGVARDATTEEIKKAFRKLARENHPDTLASLSEAAPQKVAAETKMRHLTQAFDVLTDANKRRQYDLGLVVPDLSDFTFTFTYSEPSTSSVDEAMRRRRENAKKMAHDLLNEAKRASGDIQVRSSFLYNFVRIMVGIARPLSLGLVIGYIVTNVQNVINGGGISEILFATASNPDSFSIVPIIYGVVFSLLGRLVHFAFRVYVLTMVAVYEALPSLSELSAQLKRTTPGRFGTVGLIVGLLVGHTFF